MTLTLTPGSEARLRALSAQRGLPPEETIDALLAEAEAKPNLTVLTALEETEVMASLKASVEDYAAGRWISLEDYEEQIREEQIAHGTKKNQP